MLKFYRNFMKINRILFTCRLYVFAGFNFTSYKINIGRKLFNNYCVYIEVLW